MSTTNEMGLSYGIQRVTLLLLMAILMVSCTCVSSSNLTEDRKECQDKLISLSPCLPFVSGDSKKAPAPQCCTQLRNGINKTRRCLCVLVKDRNELGLGFKVNATLALILPSVCHAPSNASDCPVLLNLAPNSTEAQVFEDFASNYQGNGNHTIFGIPTSSSGSVRRRRWIGLHIVGKVSVSLCFLIITLVCM
ncbi:hypothetical protein LguiA_024690 [Lonicera macranthoides]